MNKLNLTLIILLISAGLVNTQPVPSQNRFNAKQVNDEFKFTTLNTEWLSCSSYAPTNDELQINNIVTVIKTISPDIIALQEVGTSSTYATLDTIVRRLGNEWAGSIIPTSNDNCGQNQGIVYKKSKVQLVSASLITNGGSSYYWSNGRYPVLYNVNLLVNDSLVPVSIINIHAKAMGDASSYARRLGASVGLKALLDGSSYNSKKVILMGDFNDYLTGTQCSTCSPGDSPYKNFMDDMVNYKCLTPGLYDPAYSSPVIDNIIISNELVDNYKQNSTFREDLATQGITNFRNTTTDHVPISAIFSFSNVTSVCENINYSETFAASLGGFTYYSVVGSQNWSWSQSYGAVVSGYASGNNPNEDWLISPAFDLSGKTSATLAFSHALNYCPIQSDIINNQTLWVSSNYNVGAPASATWTQLAIPTMPSGTNWNYVNSGNITLPVQMMQNNVRFAFKYLSNATVAGNWEIKGISFNTECSATGIPTTAKQPQSTVYVSDKQIKIINQQPEPVAVYDITGRVLFSIPAVQNLEIPVRLPGVYIVHVGNEVNKVIVK